MNGTSATPSGRQALSPEALDFAPGLLAIQESPPSRMPRAVMYTVTLLLALLILWAALGHLDIVASAEGKLVPESYVKLVQPADAGIVKEILVHEGEQVRAGQVLLRMDPQDAEADTRTLKTQLALRSLQLRRIDAELKGSHLSQQPEDPPDLFRQVEAQYTERHEAYVHSIGQVEQLEHKAERDYESAEAILKKLEQTNPLLKADADAYTGLESQGYVTKITVSEKQRAYIENQQDLIAQTSTLEGLSAAVTEAQQQVRETQSKYRSDLENERMEAVGDYQKLLQDMAKQAHRSSLLELKSPQAGIVKDIATHTIGTVVSTGTVLLSIVPEAEPLVAEELIRNDDVGFVHPNQQVKIKLAAYPFQKYGLLDGNILQVWPDASEGNGSNGQSNHANDGSTSTESTTGFKALVHLNRQTLSSGSESLHLVAGMQVVAEVREGRRTVLQYLLSPIQGALHDGGRER